MSIFIGALLFFTGGFIGVSIMSLIQVGAKSDEVFRSEKSIQSNIIIDKEPPLK